MITQELKTKFLRYEDLKVQAKTIEAELKELAPELVAAVPEGETLAAASGTFSVKVRNMYRYSEPTKQTEEQLKATKKREEQDGTAEVVPGEPYLEYRLSKDGDA